ncbi:hypothetical protein B0J11DRAFT_514666 [Dendryphion nanum]|uniref:Uncharacterized protein n=1 Tax=Dendryphion nanum TaxID=256645 RepID=A0A9P9EIL9_9PLEO|nr:hypothetical protein B0J11DRAFT_514666 [Dendryphion nanum]
MQTPFLATRRRSFRTRTTTRAGLSLITLCILIYIFNEIRCLEYGCISPVGSYSGVVEGDGGRGGYVGGGTVLGGKSGVWDGGERKEKGDESVWGTHGIVGGWFFKPKNKTSGTPLLPLSSSLSLPFSSPGNDIILPMGNDAEKDSSFMAKMAKEKELYFDGGRVSTEIQGPDQLGLNAYASSEGGSRNGLGNTESFEWRGRENDPPTTSSSKGRPDATGWDDENEEEDDNSEYEIDSEVETTDLLPYTPHHSSAAEEHARWEQGEGQEDSIRISSSFPPSSSASSTSSSTPKSQDTHKPQNSLSTRLGSMLATGLSSIKRWEWRD